MRVEIRIWVKETVTNAAPAGELLCHQLHNLGFPEVNGVRLAKVIFLEVKPRTPKKKIRAMCQLLLANPVSERYEIIYP